MQHNCTRKHLSDDELEKKLVRISMMMADCLGSINEEVQKAGYCASDMDTIAVNYAVSYVSTVIRISAGKDVRDRVKLLSVIMQGVCERLGANIIFRDEVIEYPDEKTATAH